MENQSAVAEDYIASARPATNKVSVGFKCSAKNKLRFTDSSIKSNLSLSEYCEMVMSNYEDWKPNAERLNELEKKVAFYENKTLRGLCEKYQGQTIDFITADSYSMSVKVNTVQDVFTILLHSVKLRDDV